MSSSLSSKQVATRGSWPGVLKHLTGIFASPCSAAVKWERIIPVSRLGKLRDREGKHLVLDFLSSRSWVQLATILHFEGAHVWNDLTGYHECY